MLPPSMDGFPDGGSLVFRTREVLMERRLAAILAADVVGYSRLMGADEQGTLDRLRECRQSIDRLIEKYHGRSVGSAGDSVLAEFASSVFAASPSSLLSPWQPRQVDDPIRGSPRPPFGGRNGQWTTHWVGSNERGAVPRGDQLSP